MEINRSTRMESGPSSATTTTRTTTYQSKTSYETDETPHVRPLISGRNVIIQRTMGAPAGYKSSSRSMSYGAANALAAVPAGAYATVTTTGVANVRDARVREKKDMQDLNERFASYIEKVRFLEAQNKRLADELDKLKQKWGKETTAIKAMYQAELDEARRLLDESEKEKARLEIRCASLEEQIEEVRVKQVVSLGINVIFTMAMFLRIYVFLLLMMPVAIANEDAFLQITDVCSSEVQLACHYNYDGDMTGVTFSVLEGSFMCLERSGDSSVNHNCGFEFLKSEDPRTLRFAVTLDRSCNQSMQLRCRISNTAGGSVIEHNDYIKLPAQSDPPTLYVNNGQPVEASFEPIQITCIMMNVCKKTKLDIFGYVLMMPIGTNHTKEGSRFRTTSVSEAIFSQPGDYTIHCKEAGKEDIYARSYNLIVLSSQKDSDPQNATKDSEKGEFLEVLFIGSIVVSVVGFALAVTFVIKYIRQRRKIKVLENSLPGSQHGKSRNGESVRCTLSDDERQEKEELRLDIDWNAECSHPS